MKKQQIGRLIMSGVYEIVTLSYMLMYGFEHWIFFICISCLGINELNKLELDKEHLKEEYLRLKVICAVVCLISIFSVSMLLIILQEDVFDIVYTIICINCLVAIAFLNFVNVGKILEIQVEIICLLIVTITISSILLIPALVFRGILFIIFTLCLLILNSILNSLK